jgi:hypothetical protein
MLHGSVYRKSLPTQLLHKELKGMKITRHEFETLDAVVNNIPETAT